MQDWRPPATMAPTTYPGKIPPGDFLLADGRVEHLPLWSMGLRLAELGAASLGERSAVLAVGSNASPARLSDKCGFEAVVPVARVDVAGWAAVYSAHIAVYGSIAATLWVDSRSTTSLAVVFLDRGQLALVDATEPNYRRIDLGPLVDGWEGTVTGYVSRRGAVSFDGQPIRLVELAAQSPLRAMTQIEMLDEIAAGSGLASHGADLAAAVADGAIEPAQVTDWLADGRSLPTPIG